MSTSIHAGDVLAGRYRMADLLVEADGSWIWNAHDRLLHRPVAIHLIEIDDPRADVLMEAAREVATFNDRRALRVLDCDRTEAFCYVVNEWSQGTSLDVALGANGPMPPVRAAWLVHQVADIVATLHAAGHAHGNVSPGSVMIDENGEIRVIGTGVEAALLGLPTTDQNADVRGLAALLYATLTGRWPGPLATSLRRAPRDGDLLLRPRQVRAGIPRTLDRICDEVLNGPEHLTSPGIGGALGASLSQGLGSPFTHRDTPALSTAAELRDALEEFLGEHDPELSMPVQPVSVPADEVVPVHRPWHPPEVGDASEKGGASDDGGPPTEAAVPLQEPTAPAAELPVPENSSPVPAVDRSGRPLFASEEATRLRQERLDELKEQQAASDAASTGKHRAAARPSKGRLAGRGRASSAGAHAAGAPQRVPEEYWSWETSTGATGSGLIPAVPGSPVPGRNWLRLAWIVGVGALVLLLGAGFLHSRSAEQSQAPDVGPRVTTPTAKATPQPLTGLSVTDFDPRDSSGEEYPQDAPRAVDGDPSTFWGTSTYKQQFGPGGIKDGVGLVVDLGQPEVIREVRVAVLGGATAMQVFATSEAPSTVDGLEAIGSGSTADEWTMTLDEAITTQFVTVWLTALPQQDGGFRGKIAEISVLG